jgi:integrase
MLKQGTAQIFGRLAFADSLFVVFAEESAFVPRPQGLQRSALSFHNLRHTFKSALAKAGVSQELRMKLTGHSSVDMNTLYSHHELETIRNAVKTLPRLPKIEV